ncbi:MAG: DUF2189 domain-containing protein [Rhodospirillales bacterium]|nr:DUF2189 domain-containing protein [Rhodospirillales bacterium]
MAHTVEEADTPKRIVVKTIDTEAPWRWLSAGWNDLGKARSVGLTYGFIFSLVSFVLTVGLWVTDNMGFLPPLAAGFMLVAPMLAVGLYETARRIEAGEPVTLGSALVVSTRSPLQLAFMAVLLTVIMLAWMRVALLLFALFMGTNHVPPPELLMTELLLTRHGIALLIVGSAVGAVLAMVVFSISVVGVPLLMVREVDAFTAIWTSLLTVRHNWTACLLWAWLIALLSAAGIVTFFVGMIVTFPLLGFASWHAYSELVGLEGE